MMKKILTITLALFLSFQMFGQELDADDRVNITQSTKPFIGVYAFGYQGLPTPGYPQFQLNNYGGVPGTVAATADNSILGMFAFSGHNGAAKKTVGIIRVKSMDNFASALSSRMDFLIGPNREQRMTILGDSGYVGIGTETPTNELDVNGQIRMQSGAVSGYVPVSDANGVMTWTDPTTFAEPDHWTESSGDVFRSTGDVGIGGNPAARLHIRADGTTLNDGIRLTSSLGTAVDYYMYMNPTDDFVIRQDAIDAMTLQSGTQNLGLGTVTPEHTLDIYRTENAAIGVTANNAGSNAELTLKTNTTPNDELFIRKYGASATGSFSNGLSIANMSLVTAGASAGPLYTGTIGNNPVYLASSNEVAVFLDTDQDVGVGTQIPGAQLDVLEEDGDNYVIRATSNYVGNSTKYAVFGTAVNNPGYGYGGYFSGGRYGSFSQANATTYTGTAYGVRGYSTGSAGIRYGVYGQAVNSGGSRAYGVRGTASGSTINYGVYGNASGGTDDWGGYFVGNAYVSDTLTLDDRMYINNDGTKSNRLVVMDESTTDAVYIKNVNPAASTTSTSGYGVEIDAGYIGMDIDINDADLNGSCYGLYVFNTLGGSELTGSHYGIRTYASGSRSSTGSNYSLYASEGSSAGSGTSWAGYFGGDVRITGTLDNTSDARLKKDIEDMDGALDIIKQLQPKTYTFRTNEYPHMMLDERPQLGFVAQDMEKVLPQLVRTAMHPEHVNQEGEDSDIPNSPAVDVKAINYIGIIPVLTQGIKELTTTVEEKEAVIETLEEEVATITKDNAELKTELADMKNQMAELASMVNDKFNQMEEDMSSCCFTGSDSRAGSANTNVELNGSDMATLEQNSPNPFNEQTIIKYYIPSFAQKATMTITDIKGSPLKSINLEETGLGTVTINANELPVGTYVYTLYVDGRQVESKQMVLIK